MGNQMIVTNKFIENINEITNKPFVEYNENEPDDSYTPYNIVNKYVNTTSFCDIAIPPYKDFDLNIESMLRQEFEDIKINRKVSSELNNTISIYKYDKNFQEIDIKHKFYIQLITNRNFMIVINYTYENEYHVNINTGQEELLPDSYRLKIDNMTKKSLRGAHSWYINVIYSDNTNLDFDYDNYTGLLFCYHRKDISKHEQTQIGNGTCWPLTEKEVPKFVINKIKEHFQNL